MLKVKDDGEKKVQSLIKLKLSELESLDGWKELPPHIINSVRHTIIRASFGAYKIGILMR